MTINQTGPNYDSGDVNLNEIISGIMKNLNIASTLTIPEGVLSNPDVKAMKFRQSEPRGYHMVDVDEASKKIRSSFDWYTQALHQRDLDIHALLTELGKVLADLQNLKFEFEAMKSRGRAIVDEHGNFASVNSDAARVVELGRKNSELSKILEDTQMKLNEAMDYIVALEEANNSIRSYAEGIKNQLEETLSDQETNVPAVNTGLGDDEKEHYEALKEWGIEVEKLYEQQEKELESLREAVEASESKDILIRDLLERVSILEGQLESQKVPSQPTSNTVASSPAIPAMPKTLNKPTPPPTSPNASSPQEGYDDFGFSNQSAQPTKSKPMSDVPGLSLVDRVASTGGGVKPGDPLTSIREGEDLSRYF